MSNLINIIKQETRSVIEAKGEKCPEISADTAFLADLPMDSLDLATLVVTLELITGVDPFREGFKSFHTVQQLTSLYQDAGA